MLYNVRKLSGRVLRQVAHRLNPQRELDKFFCSLVRIQFTPQHIVDVGAHSGSWTRTARNYFPDANYTLIEPQSRMRDKLQDLIADEKRVRLHTIGAAANDGELTFTIHERDDSCTFAMSSGEATRHGFKQTKLPVARLDTLLKDSAFPPPDMIKIDAEGFDLEVLDGAMVAIKNCEVLLLEAAIMSKAFSNDLYTVLNKVLSLGFRPYDFTDLNRTARHGSLWLVEVAFIKRGGFVDRQVVSYD